MKRRVEMHVFFYAFIRWMLLLPAHEDEYLTKILEEIAMNQDPILQKVMNKW